MQQDNFLVPAIKASLEAGKAVLSHYNTAFDIEYKADNSPLTSADKASHDVIESILSETSLPILSEEGKDIPYHVRKEWKYFWLIDPLDGTKEFINRNGEFTINVALINGKSPILGVIYVPVLKLLYFGTSESGSGMIKVSSKDSLSVDEINELITNATMLPQQHDRPVVIMGSRSHQTPENSRFINSVSAHFDKVSVINAGSSLKFCRLAEGAADLYPRLGPTMEWDTAAGHAICKYAGINVLVYETREEMEYNKLSLLNPWFIASRPDFNEYLPDTIK